MTTDAPRARARGMTRARTTPVTIMMTSRAHDDDAKRRRPRDHAVGVMPRAPLRTSAREDLWVFAYGSLAYNAGFEHETRVKACARGFRRRFHQGSTDHRGTVDVPGRTATLERSAGENAWGVAYKVNARDREDVLGMLEIREKQYDLRLELDLYDTEDEGAEPIVRNAVTYVATASEDNLNWLGDAEDLAEQIARARGPSGENCEYLYKIAGAMRSIDVEDEYLYALEARVRAIRGDVAES